MQARTEFVHDDRSIGSLLSSLARDTATLVRNEAALAKSEMSGKMSQVAVAMVSVVLATVSMIGGFIILLEAAVVGLDVVLPTSLTPWLSEIIVGVFFMLVGIGLLLKARSNLKPENMMPRRTLHSVERDRDAMREHGEHLKEEVRHERAHQ
ncbi:MAG TPA: phage holin family protein [Gammaproteobacteria bacterium]|nr:phage holin family protein [Gammaproteobacteria bacterium]